MSVTTTAGLDTSIEEDIKRIFALQKANTQKLKSTTAKERIVKLKALKKHILSHREGLQKAIYADFKKPHPDTDLTEIFPILSSLSHITKHLKKWMRPKHVATPLNMFLSQGTIYREPKGTALIISPWNYPFQLTFDPLIYAIAAGCTVILKPSEITPNTSAYMSKMVKEFFSEDEVAIFEGDAKVAQNLLEKPFDHIFFTGSPQLGKIIMGAAAKNLTSVTLELGGKSPVVVDESVNIKDAAQKIIWGKYINCGQTCVAPDYMLVDEKIKDKLLSEMKNQIRQLYVGEGKEGIQDSEDYTRIVNQRHFQRVKNLLEDAVQKGAEVEEGGKLDENDNYIPPTFLTNVKDEMNVMEEEIFGPLFPILTYKNLQEATDIINAKPKPLALYIFGKNKKNIDFVLKNTSAGGTCINETLAHVAHPDLPFGGVNNSGIGKTHGIHGFLAFTNERAVLKQNIGWTTLKMLYPPYTNSKKKTINRFSKFV